MIKKFESFETLGIKINEIYVIYQYPSTSLVDYKVYTNKEDAQKVCDENNKLWQDYITKNKLTDHSNKCKVLTLEDAIDNIVEVSQEMLNDI